MRTWAFSAAITGVWLVMLSSSPAQAQATRTWVSGVGDDVNPCSRTAPCKTFAGAISKTATSGEINVLDPGGFGAVTITKAITISSEGFEAGVLVSGGNAINVNVPSGTLVVLRGLDIQGLGTAADGIRISEGGIVRVEKCVIRQFTGNGINVFSTANTALTVVDTLITDNAAAGIQIAPTGGTANVAAAIHNTRLFRNADGLLVDGTNGISTSAELVESQAVINTNSGVTSRTTTPHSNVFVKDSLLSENGTGGIANGAQSVLLLDGDSITENNTGLSSVSGGTLFSYKNNEVNANGGGGNGSAPTPVNQE